MTFGPAIEPDERRFEQKECLQHQDLAVALGLRGAEPGHWIKDGVDYRPANEVRGHAVPLKFTGPTCPLCTPTRILDNESVRRTTDKYRLMRRGHYDDGYGQHR